MTITNYISFRSITVFFVLFLLFITKKADAQLCSSPALVSMSVSTQNLRCYGDNSGSISVSITGGSSPSYTYSLYSVVLDPIIINNYPLNNYTFSNLPADNNYFLVIQVPIGGGAFAFCSQSIVLTQPGPLSISSGSTTNVSCNGGNDGAIDATVTGGPTMPYTYAWSNGATTEDISGLTAGNYTLTITDGNGCTLSKTFTISEPLPIAVTSTVTNVSCNAGSDGAITLTPTGGTSPYTYLWNNGATGLTVSSLTAGNYSVTITDAKGCKNILNFTITEPAAITVPAPAITNIDCNGTTTGAIDITPAGGTTPYTYLWTNAATTQDLTNVAAGSYSVTITDNQGCKITAGPYTITQNPVIALSAPAAITNVTCNGGTTGAITIAVSGGTSPYTYSWTNGATTPNLAAVPAGSYSVTVTDSKGCTKVLGPFSITEPAPISATASITDATCNAAATGAINLTPAGGTPGTPPYTFIWSNGATTEDISALVAGSYSVTITDSKGCSKLVGPFTVNQPVPIASSGTTTNVTCNGGNNGAITLTTPTGGTSPYTYLWNNGAASTGISSLTAGNYSVTITDANGCKNILNFTITEPAAITVPAPAITNIDCNGTTTGAIDITPSGGTTPYTYLWTNAATTQDLTNVAAGSYSVTITDNKGCKITAGPYTITQNPAIALSAPATITNVNCNGGTTGAITIAVSGGTSPYTYSWTNGATTPNLTAVAAGSYSVTVTDSKSCTKVLGPFSITEPAPITATASITDATCNAAATGAINLTPAGGTPGTPPYTFIWSNGATTEDISALVAGSYSVTITDSKGCSKLVGPFTVNQPVPIASSGTTTNVTCNGGNNGAITLTLPTGGTSPYSYLWNNGAASTSISSLTAGNYSVTITDAKGCKNILNFTITEPAAITVPAPAITNIDCNGTTTGAIDITPSGGTTPYTYLWTNAATTQDLTNVAAGSYSVTITDNKGCKITAGPYTITQNPAIALSAPAAITNVTCNGATTGAVSIVVSGGTSPYTYAWTNGATTPNLTAVAAGSYSVTVTDSKSCSKLLGPFTITEPTPISATASITDANCNAASTGAINLTPAGGTPTYTYVWSNGATTQNISALIAGSYSVTITDSKGCSKLVGPFTVNQPVPIASSGITTNVTCNGGNNGAITLTTPTGGTSPYTYLWNNGATTQNLSALIAGSYSVTITDPKGCKNTLNFTITEPAVIAFVSAVNNVLCTGSATGGINIANPTGGVGPYTYSWSNSVTTQNNPNLLAGSYTLTVTDSKGCVKSQTFTITEPAAINTNATTVDATCAGTATGSIALSNPTGGTAPYTYAWSNGVSSQNNPGIVAGSYTVDITDKNGCTKSFGPFVVTEPTPITASGTITIPSCKGSASGGIKLNNVTNGTPPYSYTWSNGILTSNNLNIVAGTYTVVITDSKGCSSPAPISFTINDGTPITGTASASPAKVCSGQGTTITASLDAAYTAGANSYSFNGGTSFQSSSTFSIPTIIGDTVVSVVLKDINGCLTDPILVSITTNKIAGSLSVTQLISCFGGTGELTMNITGNSSGFTYSINGSPFQSSNVFSNLPAGTYTVVVDDGGTCNSSYTTTLTEPAVLTIGIKSITDVNPCIAINNGAIAVTTNGGNLGKTFTITPSGTSQSDSLFSNLTAGSYTITVSDSKGCTATVTATVNQPASIAVTSTTTNVNCVNPISGAIDITVTGGVAPYTYLWSDGTTNQDLANIAAGSYTVTVTDSKNCQTASTIVIQDAPTITGTASASPAIVCSGQSTTITAVLDPAYTPATNAYSFDGGLTFQASASFIIPGIVSDTTVTVVLKDINGCISNPITVSVATSKIQASILETKSISCNGSADGELTVNITGSSAGYTYSINGGTFQTSNIFSNLSKGNYVIVIDDGSACNSSYTYTLTEPQPMTLAVKSIVNVNPCAGGNNGAIRVTTSGGNSGKTFTITPSGLSQTDSLFSNLFAGNYNITVIDSKGCTASTTASVIQPSGIDTSKIVPIIVNNTCPGDITGSIQLTNVTGGISPYTYILNGTPSPTSIFTGLATGKYTMIITDKNNCSANYTFTISEPQSIRYTAIPLPSSCNTPDGSILITKVTGGTPPYKYSINDGNTYSPDSIFTNLAAKVYHLRVSDNQCSTTKNTTVETKTAPVPYIRIQQPSCNGGSDGVIVVDSISGGVPLFQYSFNGIPVGSTTVYSDLKADSYTLSITDQACTYDIDSFYIYNKATAVYDTLSAIKIPVSQPDPISALTFSENTDRYLNSGIAGVYNIKGGTPGYFWSADNVTFTPVTKDTVLISNQRKGVHAVYLQDTLGCTATVEVTILVEFFIPNLITPNKDGQNDRFEIMGLPKGSELKIVNRWGNQVYLSNNYDNTWGADEDSDGIYYYELRLPNGEKHKGWLEVLR